MVTLKIMGVKKNKYLLIDEKQNQMYNLYLEFYGIDNPKQSDTITFDERLLNKSWGGYTQPYAFEVVKSQSEYDEEKRQEYAVLKINEKQILLRRIYG